MIRTLAARARTCGLVAAPRAALGIAASVACSATAQLPPTQADFHGERVVSTPFRIVHGLVVIPVGINGHAPLQLVLDTGAPVMLFRDSTIARQLGLQIAGRARVTGTGDGPTRTAPLARAISVNVGALDVTGALGLLGVGGDLIPGVDGVIGGALFSNAIVEVDWDAQLVRFIDPTSRATTTPGDTIPLRVESSLHVFVPARIVWGHDTLAADLHLDTGARQPLLLARSVVAALPTAPTPTVETVIGFGSRGMSMGRVARAGALLLGHAAVRDVVTAIPTLPPTNPARLGLPILQRFNFTVDYRAGQLILRPRAAPPTLPRFTTTGIALTPGRDSTLRVVAHVITGSPAANQGVLVGDTIVAVAGQPLTALSEEALAGALLRPRAGTDVDVVVRRDGRQQSRRLRASILLP